MALGTQRFRGLRKLAAGMAMTIRNDWSGLVDDINAAVWGSGSTLPTATGDKWVGRRFFHTTEQTDYICDGTTWRPAAGEYEVPLASFGAPASGYFIETTGGSSYVYRNGKKIDFRLRIQRTSGELAHAGTVFVVATAFRPRGVGQWPLAAIQSEGGQTARAVAAVVNAAGAIYPLTPSGVSTTIEVAGSFYMP